ncbi:MAG: L-threonylcarbamoyladenylate synthase [Desulforhabdus sp.]|nr:L-threonylcarbamoyladenylate synthase [Desulforhabdus sp.]
MDCNPRIWKVEAQIPALSNIDEAVSLLLNGGLIVYPTETFYALGGQTTSTTVIKRIYSVKGRDADKPLPLVAASATDVRRAVGSWPEAAEQLAEAFWPGPLTLVLAASPALPSELHLQTGKIAIRISPHPVAVLLAKAAGGLLISTSANISGQSAVDHPDDIEPDLLAQIDGLIYAGKLPGRMPSTIVDVSTTLPRLVRDGSIPWELIERTLHL